MNNTIDASDIKNEVYGHPIKYVIEQNQMLLLKSNSVQEKNISLSHDIEELEQEIDQLTKSKNLMQGYLKNFKELNEIEKSNRIAYENLYMYYVNMIYILTIYAITFIGTTIQSVGILTQSTIIAIFVTFIYILYRMKIYEKEVLTHVKELKNKIITINKNTDIIVDFIDNL